MALPSPGERLFLIAGFKSALNITKTNGEPGEPSQDITNKISGFLGSSFALLTFILFLASVRLILKIYKSQGELHLPQFHASSDDLRIVGAQRLNPDGPVRPLVFVNRAYHKHRHYVVEDPPPSYDHLFPKVK